MPAPWHVWKWSFVLKALGCAISCGLVCLTTISICIFPTTKIFYLHVAVPARPSSVGGPPQGGVMLPFPPSHPLSAPLPPAPPTSHDDSGVYELESFDGRVPPRPHIPPPSTGPVQPIGDMPWYWGNISRYVHE